YNGVILYERRLIMSSINEINLSNYNYTQKLDIKKNPNLIKVKLEETNEITTFSGKIEFEDFEKIKEKSNNDIEAFKKFIDKIFSYQGNHAIKSTKSVTTIKIKIETENAEEIENTENKMTGYWGAEETSQRILDFARKVSGNNPEKFDMLLGAFKQGFEEAKKCFGGELPEVCNETYDLVIKGFEDMKNNVNEIE
ncbi:hypothetical protein QUF55_07940, partial [Clostridiaceae bacterium HSG29]|nr:hypothetical protein [Clostridiaceae bacterium HSG29]